MTTEPEGEIKNVTSIALAQSKNSGARETAIASRQL
jgi:hypothetical protein